MKHDWHRAETLTSSRPVTERVVRAAQTRHRGASGNTGGDKWIWPKAKRRGEPDVFQMYVVVLTLHDEAPAAAAIDRALVASCGGKRCQEAAGVICGGRYSVTVHDVPACQVLSDAGFFPLLGRSARSLDRSSSPCGSCTSPGESDESCDRC